MPSSSPQPDVPWSVNPFSTRFVKPGKNDFLFSDSCHGEQIIDRLAKQGWTGQIEGAHGSGKSTLLHSLAPLITSRGRRIVWHTLTASSRVLSLERRLEPETQLLIDGFEQLPPRKQRWLARQCESRGCGLLVTVHTGGILPTFYRSEPSWEVTRRVVEHLMSGCEVPLQGPTIERLYHEYCPNIRELLFALYDLVETRRRSC